MAGLKTFPQAPYFDDFDETKGFLNVLMRPGYAVQTREVNQIQSIHASQLSKLAGHFFENGARVIRGEAGINNNFDFVKVPATLARTVSSYSNLQIVSASGVKAKIIFAIAPAGVDPSTLYVQYTSGSTGDANKFVAAENLTITHTDATTEIITSGDIGVGSVVSIDQGVYYLSGRFVDVESAHYILSKYSSVSSGDYSLGFVVEDKIITSDDDQTLLDNSSGTSNFSAPGAHRYKISTTFGLKPTDTTVSSYVEIVRVVDGNIATKARVNDYTVFQDILASRTNDESGDYVTNEFVIDVKEHLQTSTNRGHFTAINGGDASKLVYTLDPGKAYVRGYPVETSYNTFLVTDKARTTKTHDNVLVSLPYNSSIRVASTAAFEFGVAIDLKESSTVIGSAVVRDIRYVSANIVDIDLININTNVGKGLVDIDSVTQGTSNGTVSQYSYDATNSSAIFEVPFGFVSTFTSGTLSYRRTFDIGSSGPIVIITAPDTFSTSSLDYVCQYSHSSGVVVTTPVSVSAGSGSATLTLAHTPTSTVKVVATLTKSNGKYRTKTKLTQTDSISAAGTLTLTKSDAVKITSVILSGADITSSYDLDNGQRDTVYDFARLVKKSGAPTSGTLSVTYEYFQHSPGDYFVMNSYAVGYEEIPSYTTTSGKKLFLGSVIDFRRSVTAGGVDYVSGFASNFVKNSTVVCDYSTYLPRYDKIVVDKFGVFSVKQGFASDIPVPPPEIENALTLYTVLVNAYTFKNTDVVVEKTNNRRYTMKDIGVMDRRLETVEYYTALNLLEKQTIDQSFVNKFNTGFLVDNFKSQSIADATSPELQISYDLVAGEIRPQTPSKFIPLGYQSGTNVIVKDNMVMLDYTEVPFVKQELASEIQRIQPYILYQWNGHVRMSPNKDNWIDAAYLPDIIIDGGVFTVTKTRIDGVDAIDSNVNIPLGNISVNVESTTSRTVGSDSVVTTAPTPFIRSRLITITGVGMKPSTKLHFYFDDVLVDAYVTPSVVTTDSTGAFTCQFTIPSNDSVRFRTGERLLKVTDAEPGQVAGTHAVAVYDANGTIEFHQKAFVSTRTDVVTTSVDSFAINNTPATIFNDGNGQGADGSGDPLAETFVINSDVGAFITSIDIFFGPDAATNTMSASIDIRNVLNGYPTNTVIARKLLPASSLLPSSNGSVATKFTFDHPVFLEGRKEYAFVVKTDSETLTLWTATMGKKTYLSTDTNEPTGQYITKQTYLGSLFRSQNDRAWTAEQDSDIKFSIHRAQFASSAGSVVLSNKVPSSDVTSPYIASLTNPFQFTTGSTTVVVKHPNHGFQTTDTVTYGGVTSGSIAGIPFGEIFGAPKSVTKIDSDSYSITTTTAATSTIITGGTISATAMVVFGESMLKISDIAPSGTKVAYSLSTKAKGGVQQGYVDVLNKVSTKFNTLRYSGTNNDSTFNVTANFTSTDSGFISPVIDLHDSGAVCIANRVNDSATPKAVYVQKAVTLKNAADEFIAYVDVNRPSGSSVELYYKIAQDNVASSAWVLATPVGAQQFTTNDTDFVEYQFAPSVATGEFFVIQIKLVLKSSNEALVPRCRNLRTITLKA